MTWFGYIVNDGRQIIKSKPTSLVLLFLKSKILPSPILIEIQFGRFVFFSFTWKHEQDSFNLIASGSIKITANIGQKFHITFICHLNSYYAKICVQHSLLLEKKVQSSISQNILSKFWIFLSENNFFDINVLPSFRIFITVLVFPHLSKFRLISS